MRRFVKWLSYLLSSVAVAAGTAFVFWHHDCLVLSEELLRAGAVVRLVRPRETPMDAVRIRGDADKSISELCALSDSF